MNADRNLLFGILALQNNFIDRRALLAAFDQWTADKSKPLGEILVELGSLDVSRCQLLDALVVEHLKQHGGDSEKSLAAVSSLGSVRADLERIADPDVTASFARVANERPPSTIAFDPYATCPPSAGTPTGSGLRFTVLRPHATGGLGQVSVALDQELNREVAFKEIQERFADDAHSRARFLLEAEVTGGLEHPGIVPVYGLGQYGDGRPFYAMRFIRGDSLHDAIKRFHDEFGDGQTTAERTIEFRKLLGRFIDVCNAIEYAHSRGVLHRDLKPGNVMLGKYGETLVVDWGLAKPLGHRDSNPESEERTLMPTSASGSVPTLMGSAIGTPQYMSPEQAEGRLDELGPATDVYSLGATLYCLLTGRPPFADVGIREVVAQVPKGDFPPPRTINKGVPPALQAICLKAMAIKPAERYASARALSDDIEHWLADEAIVAHRERLGERAGRWLRRHRAAARAAALALVLVTLVSLVAVAFVNSARQATARSLVAETKAKDDATKAAKAERTANEKAQRRLTQIEKGNDILGSIFADLDPNAEEKEGKSLRVLLGERLDQAMQELEGEAVGDPLAVARLQYTLGVSQLGLGHPDKAIELLTRARATSTAAVGPDDPRSLTIIHCLAWAYNHAGKLDLAVPLSEETLERRKSNLGPRHPDTLESMNVLASVYESTGKHELAIPLYEETLALRKAVLGPDDPATLGSALNLANAYLLAGKQKQAVPLLEEAVQGIKATYGPQHTKTLGAMISLASAYGQIGKLDLAIPLYEETLKLTKFKLGPDHEATLVSMNNLAQAYMGAGKLDSAQPLMEEAIKLCDAKFGPGHPHALRTMTNLATCYSRASKIDLAIPIYEDTLRLTRAKLGSGHDDTLLAMSQLADVYRKVGRLDDALALFEEALPLMQTHLGPDHPRTLRCMDDLAIAYQSAQRLDAAVTLLEDTVKLSKARYGAASMITLDLMGNLAFMYHAAGKFDQASSLLEETFRLETKKYGAEHPKTLLTTGNLGASYCHAGRYAEAIPLLEQAHANREKTMQQFQFVSNADNAVVGHLLDAYSNTGKTEEAMALLNQEITKARAGLPADSLQLAGALANFASLQMGLKAFSQAEPLLRECLAIRERQEPDAWTTFNTRSMLGAALAGQEKFTEAEPLMVAGYEGMDQRRDQIPEQAKIRLTEAIQRLVDFYTATGQVAKADEWRGKLEAAEPKEPEAQP